MLCLLAAVATAATAAPAPTLIGVATGSEADDGAQALVHVNPSNGTFSAKYALPTSIGDLIPACLQVIPRLDAAVLCTLNGATQCVHLVGISNGTVLHSFCSADLVIDNLGFNTKTQQLFFNGYQTKKSENWIYELAYEGAGAGKMTPLVHVPGTVQVCLSAYSTASNTLYETLETQGGTGNNLVAVDTASKKQLYSVSVNASMQILMVEQGSNQLLSWMADTSYAARLELLDGPKGSGVTIAKYNQYSGNGGASVVGTDGVVYSALIGGSDFMQPFWSVLDPTNPTAATFTPINDPDYPYILSLAQV